MNLNNYYDGKLYSVEKITLAEDLIFSNFENVIGKFFTEVMTPGNEMGSEEARTVSKGAYMKSNFVTLAIPPNVLLNCVHPSIRTFFIDANGYLNINNGRPIRIISMEFKDPAANAYLIPKGTEFLVEFITGSVSLNDFRILGTSDAYPQILEVTAPPTPTEGSSSGGLVTSNNTRSKSSGGIKK